MKYITEEELERQANKVNKLARERYRLYKIKNRDGNKTKGISTKNELVLFEIINQYPLLNSHVIISLIPIVKDDAQLEYLHRTSFQTDDPTRITIWINKHKNWIEIFYGDEIKSKLKPEVMDQLKEEVQRLAGKGYLLQACENFIKGIQKL